MDEWMLSSLVPIFKGKRDPLNPNFYRGMSYRNMILNCMTRILDVPLREAVYIDKIQQ